MCVLGANDTESKKTEAVSRGLLSDTVSSLSSSEADTKSDSSRTINTLHRWAHETPAVMRSIDSTVTADLRSATDELREGGKGRILVAVSAGWFLSIGVRFVYPSLLPFLRAEFAMNLTTAGVLLTMLWAAYAVGQFPGGLLGDRIGEGNILVVSTAISMVALLAVTASISVWTLFIGTIAFGFATSLFGPTRFTIFTDIYDKRAGTAIGITMAAGNVGNTVLPPLAVVLSSYVTWRLGFGIVIPLFLAVTVALWIFVPSRTSDSNQSVTELSFETVRAIVSGSRRGNIPVVVLIQVISAFVGQGFLGFYPLYLIEVKGFSPSTAATLFALYFAVGVVVQPFSGMSRDLLGPKVSLMVLLGAFFLGLIMLPFANHVAYIVVITGLISVREGVAVINNTYIADELSEDIKNAGLGFLRTNWILVAALGPTFVGFLGDHGYFEEAFLLLAFLAGIGVVLTALVSEPRST